MRGGPSRPALELGPPSSRDGEKWVVSVTRLVALWLQRPRQTETGPRQRSNGRWWGPWLGRGAGHAQGTDRAPCTPLKDAFRVPGTSSRRAMTSLGEVGPSGGGGDGSRFCLGRGRPRLPGTGPGLHRATEGLSAEPPEGTRWPGDRVEDGGREGGQAEEGNEDSPPGRSTRRARGGRRGRCGSRGAASRRRGGAAALPQRTVSA